MSRNFCFMFTLLGLLLAPSLHAQDSTAPPFQDANPAALRKVACHGITSVPMTEDAEQALALKLVANVR